MSKISFEHLDIPIIRSCNLACKGCITHSDHKNIKGTAKLAESMPWLEFWAQRLNPASVTLFGGEPLLHPNFVGWATAVKSLWGNDSVIKVNTNGYYLDRLYDHIPALFDRSGVALTVIISVQTGIEPYLSKVYNNIQKLKQLIVDHYLARPDTNSVEWNLELDEYEVNYKHWYRLVWNGQITAVRIAVCDQYKLFWCTHYKGHGNKMAPVYDYDAEWYTNNHKFCQAKDFVTLYHGQLWKCPPMGVLEHSLDTFGIKNNPVWQPYLSDYKTVNTSSSDEEIAQWFEAQSQPQQVCNMCGFTGPNNVRIEAEERSHHLKNHWKYSL
jgi:sulfatase maturation enzyme AslB (radical SAM superfamily)